MWWEFVIERELFGMEKERTEVVSFGNRMKEGRSSVLEKG